MSTFDVIISQETYVLYVLKHLTQSLCSLIQVIVCKQCIMLNLLYRLHFIRHIMSWLVCDVMLPLQYLHKVKLAPQMTHYKIPFVV